MKISYDDILAKLYGILSEMLEEVPKLDENTDLLTDLGLDSLAVMRLVEAVEDEFDLAIPLNVLADVRTIKEFSEQLQKMLEEK
ncbi:MAG: phosphopantetheine-binding protein [Pseudomonadota bacterium]|nr:phosphopantetheine-binding protein [Pseudomonadota bacterium]